MKARIYRPAKNAMQSGYGKLKNWILEYVPKERTRYTENIMGWTASTDMNQEVQLKFPSKNQAIAYAEAHNINYEVVGDSGDKSGDSGLVRKIQPKSYADNFKWKRLESVS